MVWRSGDLGVEATYDALRRRIATWEWDTDAETRVQREQFVYGEGKTDPEDDHLRGRLVRVFDTAGSLAFTYDFKGNVLSTTRRFFDDDEADVDWSTADPEVELEADTFAVVDAFDAMNRRVSRTAPDGAVTAYTYDDGGRLIGVAVDSDDFVEEILYNARGQRTSITYGNGVGTAYTYDAATFRLTRLHTLRGSEPLQDLEYTYDPVGNILAITNAAEDTVYFDNAAVTPDQEFEYDALYRLTNAWGREKTARGRADWVEPAFGPVPASEVMQGYEQRYEYDVGGNITKMRHLLGGVTEWVRDYFYPTTSNRLTSTTESGGTVTYPHDLRGSIVNWPHLYQDGVSSPNVVPDFRDQMKRAQLNEDDYAVYAYDHAGQRARKVVKKGQNVEERRYVAGWEVWRKVVSGTLEEERTTLHVMDGERRIAMVETKTVSGGSVVGSPVARVRYQLDNHLGTSILELTESGGIISYEEYHPYGTCAWWAGDASVDVSRRRYRYTGMERDEETGLSVHGVRYYAAWLARWSSTDPAQIADGTCRYHYLGSRPVVATDSSGMGPDRDPGATARFDSSGFPQFPAVGGGGVGSADVIRVGDRRTVFTVSPDVDQALIPFGGDGLQLRVRVIEGSQTTYALQGVTAGDVSLSLSVRSALLRADAVTVANVGVRAVSWVNGVLDLKVDNAITTYVRVSDESDGLSLDSGVRPEYGRGGSLGVHELNHAQILRFAYSAEGIIALLTTGWFVHSLESGQLVRIGGNVNFPIPSESYPPEDFLSDLVEFLVDSAEYADLLSNHREAAHKRAVGDPPRPKWEQP
jgi:RHS repeat-associated protein